MADSVLPGRASALVAYAQATGAYPTPEMLWELDRISVVWQCLSARLRLVVYEDASRLPMLYWSGPIGEGAESLTPETLSSRLALLFPASTS